MAEFINIAEEEVDEENSSQIVEEFSPVLYCDEERIQQVLLGLQSNALKFTEKGFVKV